MTSLDLSSAATVALPFLRALAHEMAAPLTTMLGYAQLNLEAPGSPLEVHDDFSEIESSAQVLRTQVGLLGRLSRYLPEETHGSAQELVDDLRLLLSSAAQSAGCALEWTVQGKFTDLYLLGNPWLLRMIALAYLGGLCHHASAEIRVDSNENGLLLDFPRAVDDTPDPSPDRWGCVALGARLLRHQAVVLEVTAERARLLVPRFDEAV